MFVIIIIFRILRSIGLTKSKPMNNNSKLLLWPSNSCIFRLLLRDRNYSGMNSARILCVNYGRGGRDISSNNRHLLPLLTFKAHSQQHFCTATTISNNTSSFADQTVMSKLPDPIDQQCREWVQKLRSEWEANNARHPWLDIKLRCTNVLYTDSLKSSKVILSTEDLNPEQLHSLRQTFKLGTHVEFKLKHFPQQQSDSIGSLELENNLLGTIYKHFPDAIGISVNQYFNLQQRKWLQQCSFDIKKTVDPLMFAYQLTFLAKAHSDWCKWPGYGTMLQAFKCQPLPDAGVDPVDWIGSHGKDLDSSQCAALGAALNLKRPIVAVHGPPGSGKTHLLAEYLHILRQQGKKVLVCSKTNAGLYHLLGTFCKKFPSAASNKGTFLCLKAFDSQLASKVIAEEAIEKLIKARTFVELTEDRQDYSGEEDLKRQAEDLFKEMREAGHQKKDEATRDLLQSNSILFMTQSIAWLNFFTRNGLTFDVVIIDDAVLFPEFESWMMALPTAPVLRLFGDYNQHEIPVHSSMGRELNYRRSLLQRLDEEFGPELNFHLRRQYRSNEAIQAWSNRAFYGQRAAEPDESVRNIRLDDLLEEGKSPPQGIIMDPLVLVDLNKLEGEWREWMFKTEQEGRSWQNWGEAFLTAFHLWHLFEHIPQLHPSKIACLTRYDAQCITLRNIFSALSGRHLSNSKQIRMERTITNLHGQQFDVLLRDSVTVPPPELFVTPYHLKYLSNEMCRARRQFIWFANSKWLEEGSEQSRQLLQTFHEYGRIVGPNQLMPLEPDQFQKMTMIVQDHSRKMQEQRMRTNNNTTIFRRS